MNQDFIIMLQKEMEAVKERERKISEEEETIKRETAERLRTLTEKRAELEARRRHLQALLSLEGVEIDEPGEGIGPGATAGSRGEAVTLADQVYYYLLETGQEQHYGEITKALQTKGVQITGKDPGLNLVANIHADERFKRPRRGVYGLAEWYPKRMRSAGSRRKKARRR